MGCGAGCGDGEATAGTPLGVDVVINQAVFVTVDAPKGGTPGYSLEVRQCSPGACDEACTCALGSACVDGTCVEQTGGDGSESLADGLGHGFVVVPRFVDLDALDVKGSGDGVSGACSDPVDFPGEPGWRFVGRGLAHPGGQD